MAINKCLRSMDYDKVILSVLAEAGDDGLRVAKIAKHVLNACNSLFAPLGYDEVHVYVLGFLRKESLRKGSAVKQIPWRGYYCIDRSSPLYRQCLLEFSSYGCDGSYEEPQGVEGSAADDDRQLSLF